jgi:hypothetical protein
MRLRVQGVTVWADNMSPRASPPADLGSVAAASRPGTLFAPPVGAHGCEFFIVVAWVSGSAWLTDVRRRSRLANHTQIKGERMRETGILSIVKRGPTSQVRYASFNPYDIDRLPYPCPDEGALVTLLHHFGINGWSLQQAVAALRRGRGPACGPLRGASASLLSSATSPACRERRGGRWRPGGPSPGHCTRTGCS